MWWILVVVVFGLCLAKLADEEEGDEVMEIKGFDCRDLDCSSRWCWSPGNYDHRGATSAGSRNTGYYSKECMERAYRGCPQPIPDPEQTEDQYYAARRKEREEKDA